jgi:hypothetical protein
MVAHFPYVAAAAVTAAVGVAATGVWGAQAPPAHAPAFVQPSPPHTTLIAQPNLANTPGSAPMVSAQTAPGYFAPAHVGQIVGVPGNPGAAQVPGLTQASQYAQPGMNQAGQPPFGEMLYSMQTYMNQPGVPDFYTTYNPSVVQANEGVTASPAYPNPSTPQTGVPSFTATNVGSALTQGSAATTVGFYNGFGPGQANVGFYAGFTTPR